MMSSAIPGDAENAGKQAMGKEWHASKWRARELPLVDSAAAFSLMAVKRSLYRFNVYSLFLWHNL
jgi:hypothetical protein